MFNLYIEPYGYDRLEEGVVEENMADMAEVDQCRWMESVITLKETEKRRSSSLFQNNNSDYFGL